MDKEFLIQLTNKLYGLTLLFPKKEPLRYKMREVATDFLINQNKEELIVLDNLFEVAMAQNWVSPSNVMEIKEGYFGLVSVLGSVKNDPGEREVINVLADREGTLKDLPGRQTRILDFLKDNKRAQVWQLKEVMPEVTKRTLRRDFEHLLGIGKIERIGERNNTFYQLKSFTS
jgi:hypothetical protein